MCDLTGVGFDGSAMPDVGETMTVKINGVESVETVKEAENSLMGQSVKYIGNIDIDSLITGGSGWCVIDSGICVGFANPNTTISIESVVVHKLDSKFVDYDGLVRTFDYYIQADTLYKSLYNDSGDECILYTCKKYVEPEMDENLFGFFNEVGFSTVGSTTPNACFIGGYIIREADGKVSLIYRNTVFGTDTNEMEKMASDYGFTHTTNPKA